ncbi:sporulation protein YqfD, partial [Klebsiella pneumoniae]|nr:sporulation protein YqfD [Klebsiella pneumoniae]
MLKFLKLIYGYVIILVRGENRERFLNLGNRSTVDREQIRYREDGQLMAQMQAADFFRLRPLR